MKKYTSFSPVVTKPTTILIDKVFLSDFILSISIYYFSLSLCFQTLSCLCTIAPFLTVDYMTCQGNTRLLLLVEWAIKNDSKHPSIMRKEPFGGVKQSNV